MPVNVSATLIMQLVRTVSVTAPFRIADTIAALQIKLFGFGMNNYYRDVLVLFAFIAGLGIAVIAVVWLKVRERR